MKNWLDWLEALGMIFLTVLGAALIVLGLGGMTWLVNFLGAILEIPKPIPALVALAFYVIFVIAVIDYFNHRLAGRILKEGWLVLLVAFFEIWFSYQARWWAFLQLIVPLGLYGLVYFLAGQDMFFTFLTPGRIKVVGRNTRGQPNTGVPVKFLSVPPYYADDSGNVSYNDSPRNRSILQKAWDSLFEGIAWVGFYPIYQLITLQLSFAELKGQQIVRTEGVIFSSVYAKGFQYVVEVLGAETLDRIPIEKIVLLVPLKPVNCLRLLTKGPMDWVDAALTLMTSAIPSVIAAHTTEDVLALRTAANQQVFQTWLNDSSAYQNALQTMQDRGLELYANVFPFSVTPGEVYQQAFAQQAVAKQQAEAMAEAAKGQRAQIETIGNAFAALPQPAQMFFLIEQLGKNQALLGGGGEATGGGASGLAGQVVPLLVLMKVLKEGGLIS